MGHTIILIWAVMAIHIQTSTHQKYTDIRQEWSEWHLNILPWHWACWHGNSIGGKWAMGWSPGLYVTVSFLSFWFPHIDSQVIEGDCPRLFHTQNCSSAVLGLNNFRQLPFQSVHSYQPPPIRNWRLTSPDLQCRVQGSSSKQTPHI